MEQENYSEDEDPGELEILPGEDDVILEESVLEESDVETEAHVTAALVAGWRVTENRWRCGKDVDSRDKHQCFEGSCAVAASRGHHSDPCVEKDTKCFACGRIGRWRCL